MAGSSGEMPGMPNMGDLLKDPDLLRAMQVRLLLVTLCVCC